MYLQELPIFLWEKLCSGLSFCWEYYTSSDYLKAKKEYTLGIPSILGDVSERILSLK